MHIPDTMHAFSSQQRESLFVRSADATDGAGVKHALSSNPTRRRREMVITLLVPNPHVLKVSRLRQEQP